MDNKLVGGPVTEPVPLAQLSTNIANESVFFACDGSDVTNVPRSCSASISMGERYQAEQGGGRLRTKLSKYMDKVTMGSTRGGAIESVKPVKPEDNSRKPINDSGSFGLLPEPKNRLGSFGMSFAVNLVAGLVLLLFTVSQIHEAHVRYQEHLVYMAQPKPYVPPTPKIKLPPPPVAPPKLVVDPPKIKLPEPPKLEPLKVNVPAPALPAPAPRRVVAPPAPVVGSFSTPAPAPAAQKIAAETHAAGFGQPVGVAANPNASKPANIAAVGAFGASAAGTAGSAPRQGVVSGTGFGSNTVAGTGSGNRGGAVASTGFGSGVTAGTPGGHGNIASTGFGANAAPPPAAVARTQQPVVTALVVLSKPLPQYTAEARQLHIEGDVALEVKFDANGQVEVLRVVNGLGHGLDEQARLAASHIRFKPATKDGHPVDQVSVIHVTFQLA